MGIIAFLFFLLSPLLSVIFSVTGLIFDKKGKKIYCLLIALFFGFVAYFYIPNTTEDLYYHLHTIDYIKNAISSGTLISIDLNEPFTLIIKYFVSIIGNRNLLQFIVGSLSYYIILYIVTDMVKDKKIFIRILMVLFAISTFNFLTIVSNLFSTLGLLIFIYAVYREYYIKKKDFKNILLYISYFLVHNSLIFPLYILIMYKIFYKKNKKFTSFKTILIILIIPTIMSIISKFQNIALFNSIYDYYLSYFIGNDNFKSMHTPLTIILYMMKMLPFFYVIVINKLEHKELNEFENLGYIYLISVLTLFLLTTFSIRFIPIVVIIGIKTIADFLENRKRSLLNFILVVLIIVCSFLFFRYQVIKTDFNKINIDSDILIRNIVNIWK